MPRQVASDVERALTSLGSSPIGYKRFPTRIAALQPELADLQSPEIDLPLSSTEGKGMLYPLVMSVISDGLFGDAEPETELETNEASVVESHQVGLPPKQAQAYARPADQEPSGVSMNDVNVLLSKNPARSKAVCCAQQSISLSTMFNILRRSSPRSEVTISQLEAAFKRL